MSKLKPIIQRFILEELNLLQALQPQTGVDKVKQRKLINILKKEDGAGLVLALMVLMVLAVLGVAVAGVTIGSYKLGNISRDSNSAYYIAEAGANLAYEDIKNGVMGAYEDSANSELNYYTKITERVIAVNDKKYENFSDQFGDKPTATIKIEPAPAYNVKEYTIVSTGEINGTSRTVRKPFTVNWVKKKIGLPELPEDCAMYVDKINYSLLSTLISYAIVRGDIITSSKYNLVERVLNSTRIAHFTVDGAKNTINYNENIDFEQYNVIRDAFPELPSTEGYSEYSNINSSDIKVISANSVIDNLTIGGFFSPFGYTLTIDTGAEGNIINIVVKNLTVFNDIKIIGEGTVNLYVTNSMEFVSTSRGLNIGDAKVGQLNILYSGDNQANIGRIFHFSDKSIVFTGTIFSKKADLYFYNNVKLEGIIITFGSSLSMADNVEVTAIIYAPQTSVSVRWNSKLNGGLVADSVKFWGSNEVQYSLNEDLKQYLFGTGTGETPDLGELISSEAAVEP